MLAISCLCEFSVLESEDGVVSRKPFKCSPLIILREVFVFLHQRASWELEFDAHLGRKIGKFHSNALAERERERKNFEVVSALDSLPNVCS